jgi:phosphatidylinositol glycan class B
MKRASSKDAGKGDAAEKGTMANSGHVRWEPVVLILLICFRLVNALCIKTFFQPDEYFQSLEPAWQIAFGSKSGAWITWVCSARITFQ